MEKPAHTPSDLWTRCDEALPDSDFTRVYQFVRDLGDS